MDLLVVGDTGSTQLDDAADTARGSFKFRLFDAASREELEHFTGSDALLGALGQAATPLEFVRREAEAVTDALAQLHQPRVVKVINGFPSYIRANTAIWVANLYRDDGQGGRTNWADVDIGALWREAVRDDERWALQREDAVLVVNDMLPGIAGFLVAHANELAPGDQVLYVTPGGGCGVIEATILRGQALICGTEQGHSQFLDPTGGEFHELEQRWVSAPALVNAAQRLAAAHGDRSTDWADVGPEEVTELAAGRNAVALAACDELLRALAWLTAHRVQCGMNWISLNGGLVGGIDRALRVARGRDLAPTLRELVLERCQDFLVEQHGLRIVLDSANPDNTVGGAALAQAEQVAAAKGNLWTIPWPPRPPA